MRTILLVSLAALGACASDPEPPAPPMPTARADNLPDGTAPATTAACLTRYTYPWLGLRIDCSTVDVGGDAHHRVMSCAIPADFGSLNLHGLSFPLLRHETTTDDRGFFLHELVDVPPGLHLGYVPGHDVSYVYDGLHRLAEIIQLDATDAEVYHLVVGPRDDVGNPVSLTIDVLPLAPFGVPLPATAHLAHAYTYDAHGRLIGDEGRYADGVKYYDETISYADAALRRDHVVLVDVSGETHDGSGPGFNSAHEFLDRAGHVLLVDRTVAGDPGPLVVGYRYDRHERLSTQTVTRSGFTMKVDYIYECP
jgi:hypothetical protein